MKQPSLHSPLHHTNSGPLNPHLRYLLLHQRRRLRKRWSIRSPSQYSFPSSRQHYFRLRDAPCSLGFKNTCNGRFSQISHEWSPSAQLRLCSAISKSKFQITRARMNRISAYARLPPVSQLVRDEFFFRSPSFPRTTLQRGLTHFMARQVRGPYENGWKLSRRSLANSDFSSPLIQRSGRNSCARVKLCSLRYITRWGTPNTV